MRIIFSYDVRGDHMAFKKLLVKHGFVACLNLPTGKLKLPSTTLIAAFETVEVGLNTFQRLAAQAGVIIEKVVAAECGLPTLLSDTPC